MFVTLALMYFNVLRRRAAMRLTVLETFEAKAGVQYHLGNAAVGVVSMPIVAIGGEPWAAWSGMSYALIGVVQGVLGAVHGTRRRS